MLHVYCLCTRRDVCKWDDCYPSFFFSHQSIFQRYRAARCKLERFGDLFGVSLVFCLRLHARCCCTSLPPSAHPSLCTSSSLQFISVSFLTSAIYSSSFPFLSCSNPPPCSLLTDFYSTAISQALSYHTPPPPPLSFPLPRDASKSVIWDSAVI